MSIQVELEPDDHKFIKEAKGWWVNFKKQLVWMLVATVFGFGLGKIYTYNDIATDCRVLGMFRIGITPVDCRISKVPA